MECSQIKSHWPGAKVVLANGEAHSVVGSLDLNQGIQIPGQLSDDYSEFS
jgi:hypothetical protein